MTLLKRTLYVIGAAQLVLGFVFLVPGLFAATIGLVEAPEWVDWLFAMFGARALGFGYGMFLAARDPQRNLPWIRAMIGIQAIDWIATLAYLVTGAVTLAQVTTAVFLPVVFIVVLTRYVVREMAVDGTVSSVETART
ncbi:MAG: hypothetical protein GXP36_09630 [Actinobacteria bacterium]|nr:hypothetical protein [Actinomycetota bacterium]